jgi:cold shock CspA family protein
MKSDTLETLPTELKLHGRVKWFNTKKSYGFIIVSTESQWKGTEIFVHHSAICVGVSQYKYLVQGEYVEFQLVKLNNGTHEYQASNVSGIDGGKLMCETIRETKSVKTTKTVTPSTAVVDDKYITSNALKEKKTTLRAVK